MKAIISIVPSQRQRSIYITKEAAGYGKGKRAKIFSFFFQISTLLQVEPLMYFTFWKYPEYRSFHFN